MSRPTVYVETTVIGHLTARPQAEIPVAARQLASANWWSRRSEYEVFISQIVLDECRSGDATAAAERLTLIAGLALLNPTPQADDLAEALIAGFALPPSEPRDALHIAIAATNGVQYLLTWNFRHIANPAVRNRIEAICRQAGFSAPIICSPDELMGA